jgi:hypothetical protein
MAKYVLAYHGGGMAPPEEQEAAMAAWGTWFGELGDAVVDMGNPIMSAKTVNADGSVSDGGGANPLTGYSLIQADSLDAATALVKGCPVLSSGGSVEVAEAIEM